MRCSRSLQRRSSRPKLLLFLWDLPRLLRQDRRILIQLRNLLPRPRALSREPRLDRRILIQLRNLRPRLRALNREPRLDRRILLQLRNLRFQLRDPHRTLRLLPQQLCRRRERRPDLRPQLRALRREPGLDRRILSLHHQQRALRSQPLPHQLSLPELKQNLPSPQLFLRKP